MFEGSRHNNDACVGLSCSVIPYRISVWWCILGGDKNILQGAGSGWFQCPHPVSLVEPCEQIVMFSEIVMSFYECCNKCFLHDDDRRI